MRLLDTGLRISGGVAAVWGFAIFVETLFSICPRVWSFRAGRLSLMIIRYDPDFDDKILSVYM